LGNREELRGDVRAKLQLRLLMSQPGVGPVTALAFALTVEEVSRFRHSKQVSSYPKALKDETLSQVSDKSRAESLLGKTQHNKGFSYMIK
jgi:hypothetical protein